MFIVYALAHLAVDPPRSHAEWRGWILSPGISIVSSVLFAALLAHAWVGLRDVIMDYVDRTAARVLMLAVLTGGLWAMAAWTTRIFLLRPN